MTSPARIEANRMNALRSTGPKTPEGKAASRLNALSHGMTAATAVLPFERREDYDALLEALRREFEPVGTVEDILLARIASRILRLARVERIEAGVLVWELHGDDAELSDGPDRNGRSLRELLAVLGHDDPVLHGARERARIADAARSDDLPRLGRAFIRDASGADALSKLSRYEARLDRALFRDLAEFHSVQRVRMANPAD